MLGGGGDLRLLVEEICSLAAVVLEATGLKLLRTVAGNGFSVFESAAVEVEKD